MKKNNQYKCKKCGSSDNFFLDESLGWSCWVDENNSLNCKNSTNEVNKIVCTNCDTDVKEGLDAFSEWNF